MRKSSKNLGFRVLGFRDLVGNSSKNLGFSGSRV